MPDDIFDALKKSFPQLVTYLRERRGLTVDGLVGLAQAHKADFDLKNEDITRVWLEGIESGERSWLSHDVARLLAKVLDCNDEERLALLIAAFPTYVFGQEVSRLRNSRDWSRPDLVEQLLQERRNLDPDGVLKVGRISETWLRQIEEGRRPDVDGTTVELLVAALGCSGIERVKLLMMADRNPLRRANGKAGEDLELILSVAEILSKNPRGKKLLSMMFDADPEKFANMTEDEIFGVLEKGASLLKSNKNEKR